MATIPSSGTLTWPMGTVVDSGMVDVMAMRIGSIPEKNVQTDVLLQLKMKQVRSRTHFLLSYKFKVISFNKYTSFESQKHCRNMCKF